MLSISLLTSLKPGLRMEYLLWSNQLSLISYSLGEISPFYPLELAQYM